MGDTLRSQTISTTLQQIAKQASDNPNLVFTTLAYHMDVDFLREAYHRVPKKKSSGVDQVTAKMYAADLENNLKRLYKRMKSGQYQAPPVKRIWVEKEDNSQRPIGIPTFEDKIVQKAVSMLLGAVFEQDFYEFSYGYREGRNPHQALKVVRDQCMSWRKPIRWILDVDVSSFFDSINHEMLREIIKKRVNDGGLLRYIGKWLNAGILEGVSLSYTDQGTPQGGVISPLLANIFLHEILDDWFVKEVQPRMKGHTFVVRLADDFIIGFETEEDARRVLQVLSKRFVRFGLTIHPKKTKLIRFTRPEPQASVDKDNGSFDFLGVTHFWARSLKGNWIVKRKTKRKRLNRSMKSIWIWCRDNRHEPVKEQYKSLCAKLRGHFQYFGIIGNYKQLEQLHKHAEKAWKYWLSRCSRTSYISWEKFEHYREVFPFPKPRIIHNI
jgi:RNA-directed DNA polymerase